MAKEVMRRTAADNLYLHKDFHGALSRGIEYLDQQYGEDAVREYLRQFAKTFYSPLTNDIRERGLIALKEHWERIYQLEGGEITLTFSPDELVLKVKACPAVMHMRQNGYRVARLWSETTRVVNEGICEGTPFQAELLEYDEETGASVQRFSRRSS